MHRQSRGPSPAIIVALSAALCLAVIAGSTRAAGKKERMGKPSIEEARRFVDNAENHLLDLWTWQSRAEWVLDNFITTDTEKLAAEAQKKVIAATTDYAIEAVKFDGLDLPYDVKRKLKLMKLSLSTTAPTDPKKQSEQAEITTRMQSVYGKGRYCPDGSSDDCLTLNDMTRIMAESRDPEELLDVWVGWRTISPPMRPGYQRFVELANEGAREMGFEDLGALWRSNYDMPPDDFAAEVERLWRQVKPLYLSLHAYVRTSLAKKYGSDLVPGDAPIPAHLLGNMWSQSWVNIFPLVAPPGADPGIDVTELLRAKNVTPIEMVKYGERFFTSLGFEPLPKTFWERSLFVKPKDREVVCHPSAWNLDQVDDLRIKMCIEINGVDFSTIHHELGHNFYQRAYNGQPPLYRGSANDGFHEAIGDAIALSVTPSYLEKVDLLDGKPQSDDITLLMQMALDKIAFLPFGLLIDQWRWKVFSGEIRPADYNEAWWELRKKYQGIAPPVARTEKDFDPGAKYHIAANVPYTRYFLSYILQFQFHRALCSDVGFEGPLYRCSIYGNEEAGRKLNAMLQMGQSRPWPEALEAMTGSRQLDATAILDYFAPLADWLDEQNRGQKVGF